MKKAEFQAAYGAFVDAVNASREGGKREPVTIAYDHAVVLEMYMFDPECSLDDEGEDA